MRKIIALFIFICLGFPTFSQTHILWETLYYNNVTAIHYNNVMSVDMEMDSLGNTYTMGYGEQNSGDTITNRDVIVLKHDTSGNLLASQTLSLTATSRDLPVKLKYASNGNLYVLVNVTDTSAGNKCLVYCLDKNLLLQWQNIFSNLSDAVAVDFAIDNSGNVFIAGNYHATGQGQNIFIHEIKTNQQTKDTIYNNLNSTADEAVNRIKTDRKGNVFMVGYQTSQSKGKQLLMIKYDKNLRGSFVKVYDGTPTTADEDFANDITFDNFNYIYVTGKNFFSGLSQAVTMKCDTLGKIIWKKQFPQSPEGRFMIYKFDNIYVAYENFKMVKYAKSGAVLQTVIAPQGTHLNDFLVYSDSTFWMMGRTDTIMNGVPTYQGFVIKYFPSGTQIYKLFMPSITYNNVNYPGEFMAVESYGGMMYTCARKFRLAGAYTYCIKKQKFNEYPLKLSSPYSDYNNSTFNFFPNPASDQFEIYSEKSGHASIINAQGKMELEFDFLEGSNNVDVSTLSSGIYFLTCDVEGTRQSRKILIQ